MRKIINHYRYKLFFVLISVLSIPFFAFNSVDRPEALHQKGLSYYQERAFDKAFQVWSQCVEQFPDFPDPYPYLVQITYSDGRFAETARYGKGALRFFSNKVDLYFSVGNALSYIGKLEDAISVLKQGLKRQPSQVDFLFSLSEIELARKKMAASRSYLFKILKIQPKNEKAAYEIAMRWGAEDKKREVRKWLEKAHRWNPKFVPALFALALLDLKQGRDEEAQKLLLRVIKIQHVHPRAFFYLAGLCETKKELLKQYYWLNRAQPYFQAESEEKEKIIETMAQIEEFYQLDPEKMKFFSKMDVSVQLGLTQKEVLDLLGAPTFQNKNQNVFIYMHLSLIVHFEGDNVNSIVFEKGFFGKVHGLRLREREEKLLKIYGEPQQKQDGSWEYAFSNELMTISIKKGKIDEIILESVR